MNQAGIGVMATASETEGNERRAATRCARRAECVGIIQPLCDCAVGCIDYEVNATDLIRDQAEDLAAADHVVGHISPGAVDETGDDIVVRIEFGDNTELIAIEPMTLVYDGR